MSNANKKQWTTKDVEKILTVIKMTRAVSLSTPIKSEADSIEDTELQNFIIDDNDGPQEIIEKQDRNHLLLKYINKLKPRELEIISTRYGLYDGEFKTLDEVGSKYNVTREYVRQIELKALDKLRHLIITKDGYNINDF